eukprot:CAMPEP_0172520556 /NCGR_PEP_ID=MMETSP1066-20121228/292076_1 /TAXON_ID=671091 /ORGANISM="Coscinodiscus wailesii, Strain CCMP2513" /LENGTH=314 /DNA_ID=CAMNT_0013303341 /DNA_START=204 /DNA_END=1145 /DNA_ORIENTATION=+
MSRRQAERLIRDGKATISGKVTHVPSTPVPNDVTIKIANKPAVKITTGEKYDDGDGDILKAKTRPAVAVTDDNHSSTRVWIVNKLSGEIVTEHDPRDRPALLRRLKQQLKPHNRKKKNNEPGLHLKPIGRLDMTTEGLILLTNDGHYAREMELPRNEFHRTYRARVFGQLTPRKLESLRRGVVDRDGVAYKGVDARLEMVKKGGIGARKRRERAANTWLRVTCVEGKNRQVRKMLEVVGLRVTRLIRIAYGDYSLKDLPQGASLEVPVKPIASQKKRGGDLLHKWGRQKGKKEKKDVTKEGMTMQEKMARPVKW